MNDLLIAQNALKSLAVLQIRATVMLIFPAR